jgi:hypothetical protein
MTEPGPDRERIYWLDKPGSVTRIVWGLYALCILLLAVDILVPKHGPFAIEHFFGFYAFFGFVACVGLVLAARVLRLIMMRPEDYYER